MAFRLGDLVVRGDIFNTRRYSVHGWIELKGQEQPLLLHLTGNCSPDLAGWHFRFEARPSGGASDADSAATPPAEGEPKQPDLSGLAWQQIGPTGTMTAARKVKVADCPPTELYLRCQMGEPPPMEWKRCLYLEWFSQNGRVVIELADPILEFVEFVELQGVAAGDGSSPILPDEYEDLEDEDPAAGRLGITAIGINEDGETEIRDLSPPDQDEEADDIEEADDLDDEDHDPYGLIPDDLQRELDAQTFETDRAIEDDADQSAVIGEMELMDDLIERGDGEPVGTIFDDPLKLPQPDQLDDEQVEAALKSLLGQLALFGIALDVCGHFTPRDAYRLLVERICRREHAYPELRHTQWVQHFMTSEYCSLCEEEFEREYEEKKGRMENPGEEPAPDESEPGEDLPY
jgi:hypothetical protein